MTVMDLRNVTVTRGGQPILDRVSVALRRGEVFGIIGPNGAGKSTLLRVMAGLLRPSDGDTLLDGRAIEHWGRRPLARRVAYLPQSPEIHWPITVERLVALGRLPRLTPWTRPSPGDDRAIRAAMQFADVLDLAGRPITTLSGGERARALLARALAGEPEILLADEPASDLDPYHQLEAMDHLRQLSRRGASVVVVLHDLTLVTRFCNRVALLDHGRLVAVGPPEPVLSQARLAAVYRVDALRGRHGDEAYLLPWAPHAARPEGT